MNADSTWHKPAPLWLIALCAIAMTLFFLECIDIGVERGIAESRKELGY